MESDEKHKRAEDRLTINKEFESFEAFVQEYVTNISRTGVFIRSPNAPPVGTLVNLRFTVIMEAIETIEGVGEVVRVEKDASGVTGMGVVFRELSAYSKDLIEKSYRAACKTLQRGHDRQIRHSGKTPGRAGNHPSGPDQSSAATATAILAAGWFNLGGRDAADLCRPDRAGRLGLANPHDRNPCRIDSAHCRRRRAALDTDSCAGRGGRCHIPPASAITASTEPGGVTALRCPYTSH